MSRQEATKQQRRRRNSDALGGKRRRLAVDESKLDREKFEYRFANDTDDRVHQLTVNDDWEVVTDRSGSTKDDATGMGSTISVRVGGGVDGVLLRKPKQFYNDDYAASQRRIDATETALQQGATPGGDLEGTYRPDDRSVMAVERG